MSNGKFVNPHSLEKGVSRYHVKGFFELLLGQFENNIWCLTLPHNNFIFEQMLLNDFKLGTKINLTCLEKDKNTYHEGLNVKPKNRVEYLNEDVFHYLNVTNRKYNFIWLDLCACLSKLLVIELQNVVDSAALGDDCLLCITVQKARERSGLKGYYKTLCSYRNEGFPKSLGQSAANVNRSCELLEVYNYKSYNKVSAPMSIYVFQIKKLN